VGIIGTAAAKPGVFVLYGSAFDGMVLPLLLFMPGVIAEASSALLSQYYIGCGRLWVVLAMTVGSVLIQVALLALSIPRWGILGAVGATACGYLVTMMIRVGVFRILEGVSLRELLPRRDDAAFLRELAAMRLRLAWRPVAAMLHAR